MVVHYSNFILDDCVEFLQRQAAALDLPTKIVEVNPGKPIVIISWKGTDPAEKSIFLNSHMDVVPVYAEKWTFPPFSAHMDEQGRIYARGSQDMKCVGIQFLGVIRALKHEGRRLKRTLHVVFVPDEEIGGILGMKDFVKTDHFKELNCGFGIDEGYASENDTFRLTYGERTMRREISNIMSCVCGMKSNMYHFSCTFLHIWNTWSWISAIGRNSRRKSTKINRQNDGFPSAGRTTIRKQSRANPWRCNYY